MNATAMAVIAVFSSEHSVSSLALVLFAPARVQYGLVPVGRFHVSDSALPDDAYFALV